MTEWDDLLDAGEGPHVICHCCGDVMSENLDDAPFCWHCGLYQRDPVSQCDAGIDHRAEQFAGWLSYVTPIGHGR